MYELTDDNFFIFAMKHYDNPSCKGMDEFKDDLNLALIAVKQNGLSISFVEGVLRKNKEIIIEAIKQNRESYDFVDNSMKLDKDVSAAFMKYSMI